MEKVFIANSDRYSGIAWQKRIEKEYGLRKDYFEGEEEGRDYSLYIHQNSMG